MFDKSTLEDVKNLYKTLATFHDPALVSTESMPNWNASFTQIMQIARATNPQVAIHKTEVLLRGTFSEMVKEIPLMVKPTQLTAAMKIYEQMKTHLESLAQREPAPTALQDEEASSSLRP